MFRKQLCEYLIKSFTDAPLQTTRRYGPLRGPNSSSCGGLRPSAEAKKSKKFQKIQKFKKVQKIQEIQKNLKNLKKSKKI